MSRRYGLRANGRRDSWEHVARRWRREFAAEAFACGLAAGLALWVAGPRQSKAATPAVGSSSVESPKGGPTSLLELSLEELMDLRVTSASRKEQAIGDVAAAVTVLTSEDLRRSGAMSIPEALRLVPGLQVARIDANKWAISARGFSDRFANKLLVLVDGRSIYTHLFSGVYWETLDIPFELIDRIEVIRGPGGGIWGANAVTGVVNIITKPAGHSSYVAAGAGTGERAALTGIVGRQIRPGLAVRAHGLLADRARGASPHDRVDDSWQTGHLGLRLDWRRNVREKVEVISEAGRQSVSSLSRLVQVIPPYTELHQSTDPLEDESVLAKWTRQLHGSGELSAQVSYQTHSISIERYLAYCEHALDLELVDRMPIGGQQELLSGLEYRLVRDQVDSTTTASLDPLRSTATLWSAFLQHEWRPFAGRLIATSGAKFERYRAEDMQVQPDFRLLFHPTANQAIWGAVSKAVRTPARVEEGLRYRAAALPANGGSPDAPALVLEIEGNPRFGNERVLAYDGGYRFALGDAFTVDLTGYYDQYRGLRSNALGDPRLESSGGVTYVAVPLILVNTRRARTSGGEVLTQWRVRPDWRITFSYARFSSRLDGGAAYNGQPDLPVMYPGTMWLGRSWWNPSPRWELDLQTRGYARFPTKEVASYLSADVRLGYRWSSRLRTDLMAQNLLSGPHREFVAPYALTELTAVRPIYGVRVEWRP